MLANDSSRIMRVRRKSAWWLFLVCFVLGWDVAAAQDRGQPANRKQEEKQSGSSEQASRGRGETPSNQADNQQDGAAPERAQPGRLSQKARPARTGGARTPARQPADSGEQTPPADGPNQNMDPEVQRKIDELLRKHATSEVPDPDLQRQITELLESQTGVTNPTQPDPGQPEADPAAPQRTDPREAMRQRTEERRKRMEEMRQGGGAETQPGDPQSPALPPPQTAFQRPMVGTEPPSGPTSQINIPPSDDPVRPEDRTYGFSIKNGTYEQLIEGFARQTGLGVIGDAPQGGSVNFVTTEELSFQDALGRVRMLLFNFKPHEPYWLLRNEGNLQIIRVTDLYRIIPPDRVFQTLADYRAANLPQDEIALVFFTPTNATASDLTIARDFLPDYVRLTPVPEQNRIAIFALVRDIERYLDFLPIVGGKGDDPRRMERIEIKFITPSDALNKLSQMTTLDGAGARTIQRAPRPGAAAGLETIPEPGVNVIADDQQGVLIVRAMPDKIVELRKLLSYIDVDTSMMGPGPVVLPLQHARADEIIPVVQQMLAASPASTDMAAAPRAPRRSVQRRPGRPGAATGMTAITADSVSLVAHPSNTSIIIIAPGEAEIEDVKRLIALVDVPHAADWSRIPIANADPEIVKETLLSIMGDVGPRTEATAVNMFVDPLGGALWYSGSHRDLERARDLVNKLDVAGDPVKYRSIRLEFQLPSFVAGMLSELDGMGGGAAVSPQPAQPGRIVTKGRLQRGASPPSPGKFKPDDVTKTLWVLCTDAEWANYLPVIKQLDVPPDAERPPFIRIPVQHVSAEKAVERLSNMIGGTNPNISTEIRLIPTTGAILVMGSTKWELEQIKTFLSEVDLPSVVEQRTFEIRHADPAEIKSVIEALLTGDVSAVQAAGRPRIRSRPDGVQTGVITGPSEPIIAEGMTIIQMGNKLIVRATPERLEEITALIAEFDVAEGGTRIEVYSDFPIGADIDGIADTINSVLSGTAPGRGGIRPRDGSPAGVGPRLIPQSASGRLVVIATDTDHARIEELLQVLRFEINRDPFVVEFIAVRYADPSEIVEAIEPVLAIKVRGMVSSGMLSEPMVGEDVPGATPAVRRRVQMATGGGSSDRYHLTADPRNKRIVVAAPQLIVDEVQALVLDFDIAGQEREVIFRTIELTNASPADMIRAVKEMFGKPSPQRIAAVRRGTPTAQASASPTDIATGESLTIVEAPGGNAIILHGAKIDVEQAIDWITQLDSMSNLGRVVRVYDVQYADVAKVFDLVVNVVDGGRAVAPAPARGVRGASGKVEEPAEDTGFTTSKTYTGSDMYIHADLIGRTMLVAATPSKITQVERLLKNFEADEIKEAIQPTPPIPKFTYSLKFASPTEASWDLQDALKAFWDPAEELPQVEAATFTDALIIRYPHEDRFAEIREIIRTHVDVPDPELFKTLRRSRTPPQGINAEHFARHLMNNLRDVSVELIDETPEKEEEYDIEEVKPLPRDKRPFVLPASMERARLAIMAAAIAQSEPDEEQTERSQEEMPRKRVLLNQEPEPEEPEPDLQDDLIRDAVVPTIRVETSPPETPTDRSRSQESPAEADKGSLFAGEKLKVFFNRHTGEVIIEGPSGVFDAVDEAIEELEKEMKEGVQAPPDIRIVRVRYIDVYTAQDIIEEMFNATRQQRAEAQQLQARQLAMQQQAARLQQQQAAQATRQGARGRGDEDPQQQARDAQQQQLQALQQQAQSPQLPPTMVRVYPNPRDRSLILRADSSQYAQIYKLLATIDQPKPYDSFMRVYSLSKLNAKEVEEMLRNMLSLDAAGTPSRSRSRAGDGSGGSTSGPGSQLPQTLLQETVGGTNQLGVDPEDIKIFASESSNSIMAMAPKVALDHIGEIIDKLESGDIPQRVTKFYALKYAAAESVVEYLAAHFSVSAEGRTRQSRGDGGATTVAGGGANSPAFIPYSLLNQLTVHATEAQIAEIDDIIARLDVETDQDRWHDVRVTFVDAAKAADVLSQMFGGAARGGAPTRTGSPTGTAGPRFIGEEGGGIVLFAAPQNMHPEILDTIAKLEEQYKVSDAIRVITLQHAAATGVADAITKAYESGRAGPRGGGPSARFTITAHDPSKQLFVKASDDVFAQIESLVASLDKPQMPEFRIYPLVHANAKAVHGLMTKLMGEYLSRVGGGVKLDAFSVQVDEMSNALIVLGGPTVFGFVEENLRMIDNPMSAPGKMLSEVIPLINVDAAEIAQNLQRSWTTRGLPPELTPQIEANRGTNVLVIRGTQNQIDEMKRTVIEPMEKQGAEPGQTIPIKTFVLKFADPGSVADAVGKLFRPASQSPRDQVQVTADYGSNSIIVSAGLHNMNRIEDLIAQIDTETSSGQGVHVLEIKHADPQSVAQALNEVYVRGAQQPGRGSQPVGITITAIPGSQAVVVRAKAEDLEKIRQTLSEMDTPEMATGGEVRIVSLLYADAGEISQALQAYLKKTGGRGGELMGDVRLSSMPQSNAIMIAGAREEVERLAGIVNAMDIAGEKGNVPQIIPLKFANSGLLMTTLQEVFTGPAATAGSRRGTAPPVITADPTGEFLIVRASTTDMAAIEQMVAKLDTEDQKGKTPFKIIQVKAGVNVTTLADQVQTSINETAKARAGSSRAGQVPSIMTTPDSRTNTITIAGSPALFADAESMIKTLEELGPAGGIQTRVISVKQTDLDEIQRLIDQLTKPAGGDSRSRGTGSAPRPPARGRRP